VADVPTFPARSVPRTEKLCCPGARPFNATGLVHAWNAPPSTEHAKVTPCSFAVNEIVAPLDDVAAAGPFVIVTTGAVVSAGGCGFGGTGG
jgi:hypothetical protein